MFSDTFNYRALYIELICNVSLNVNYYDAKTHLLDV